MAEETKDFGDSDTYFSNSESDINDDRVEEKKTNNDDSVEKKSNEVKKIHRNYLPRDKVSRAHAISVVGPEFANNAEIIAATIEDVENLRKDALDFFRQKVRTMMTEKLLEMKIHFSGGIQVRTLRDLRKYISKETLTLKFFEKYFHVMYGLFDLTLDWSKRIEYEYMTRHNIEYIDTLHQKHKGRDKTCMDILVNRVKSEIVNEYQKHCRTKSGMYMTLELGKDMEGKRIRRKHGIFYEGFVKFDEDASKKKSHKRKRNSPDRPPIDESRKKREKRSER